MMEPNGVDKDCVSISSCEEFDWSLEDASPFLLNLKELSLGNVSPDTATMVAYLRSNVVSPVEVEMDVEQATAGTCTCAHTYSTRLQYMYVCGSVWPSHMCLVSLVSLDRTGERDQTCTWVGVAVYIVCLSTRMCFIMLSQSKCHIQLTSILF